MLFLSVTFFNYRLYEWLLLILFLFPQVITDLKNKAVYIIPNIVGAVFFNIVFLEDTIFMHVLAVLPGVILIIISLLIKESIGEGDGLVVIALGSLLGVERVLKVLLVGSALAGLLSVLLLLVKKADKKTKVSFIPFLFLGVMICGIL